MSVVVDQDLPLLCELDDRTRQWELEGRRKVYL